MDDVRTFLTTEANLHQLDVDIQEVIDRLDNKN